MQKKLISFLRTIDAGGATANFNIKGSDKQYKTIFGGSISLLIYCLSLAYFVYVIYLWGTGLLIPKIQVETKVMERTTVHFDTSPKPKKVKNPFQEDGNILTPLVFFISGQTFSKPKALFYEEDIETNYKSWPGPAPLKGFTLNINSLEDNDPQLQVLVMLARCEPSFLSKGKECSSDADIDEYLDSPLNLIGLQINLEVLNEQTQRTTTLPLQYYFLLDKDSPVYNQVVIRRKIMTIDSAWIFQMRQEYEFVSSAEVVTQTLTPKYMQKQFNINAIYCALLRLDRYQDIEFRFYPKLGEVFADIGSICTILFSLRYLIQFYNTFALQEKLVQQIIFSYFRETSQRVQAVKTRSHHPMARQIAQEKLNVFNLYHEIIKMQLILQELIPGLCKIDLQPQKIPQTLQNIPKDLELRIMDHDNMEENNSKKDMFMHLDCQDTAKHINHRLDGLIYPELEANLQDYALLIKFGQFIRRPNKSSENPEFPK